MTLQEIEDALSEAERVKARHDGVHRIHEICANLGIYRMWIKDGFWKEANHKHDFQKDFEQQMKDVRHIDKTGFPLRRIQHD